MANYDIKGIEQFGVLAKKMQTDITNQVNLANKTAVNTSIDLIAYGRTTAINAKNATSKGIVVSAANALRVPVEHIFYRSFTAGIKVTKGKNNSIKPYASLMIRGNGISLADLLIRGNEAKALYGFQTRKKKVGNKIRPNMKSKAANARGKGSVTINGKTYANAYIADGSYRASSEKINNHYMRKLGASAFKLQGKQMMVFRKKNEGQTLPYPSKVVKITEKKIMFTLYAAANRVVSALGSSIDTVQRRELVKRMKKLGITIK